MKVLGSSDLSVRALFFLASIIFFRLCLAISSITPTVAENQKTKINNQSASLYNVGFIKRRTFSPNPLTLILIAHASFSSTLFYHWFTWHYQTNPNKGKWKRNMTVHPKKVVKSLPGGAVLNEWQSSCSIAGSNNLWRNTWVQLCWLFTGVSCSNHQNIYRSISTFIITCTAFHLLKSYLILNEIKSILGHQEWTCYTELVQLYPQPFTSICAKGGGGV